MQKYFQSKKIIHPLSSIMVKGIVSPKLSFPNTLKTTEYALNGKPFDGSKIIAKYTKQEIPKLRKAARLARKILEYSLSLVQPGISTDDIDRMTHEEIIKHQAYPTPLNYFEFPKSICTSVNEVVCHGIPDSRILLDGDIISIDISLYIDGYHGDNCGTVMVGTKFDQKYQHLIDTTKLSVDNAIKTCKPGSCLSEIGNTIESIARSNGYGIVHNFCGHGTGKYIHMAPTVLPFRNNDRMKLESGMVFTIEPILTEGSGKISTWEDGWTAVSIDGGWSAQIEHEVLITDDGVEVLTVSE